MTESYSAETIAKIQYQCRRGMLELDVFLMPFCRHCFLDLSKELQQVFIELLAEADPDLFNWLMGYGEAKKKYLNIVKKIRDYRLSTKVT